MFKAIDDKGIKALVSIKVDGNSYDVTGGETVASAMLQLGFNNLRNTPVKGKARSAFCMMGVCFDCLVVVDGLSDQQACMTAVQEGMDIKRQKGSAELFSLSDISREVIK